MFYVLNTKESIKNNDPYKVALKGLLSQIKKMDLSYARQLELHGDTTSMDDFVSHILKNTEELNTKVLQKGIKAVCKEFSIEELYYMYITAINDLLTEEFMHETAKKEGVDLKNELPDYDKILAGTHMKILIGILCGFAITFKEQLLDKKLEYINIDPDHTKTKMIKSLRKERYSLYKGINEIPLLLTENEAKLLSDLKIKLLNDGYGEDILDQAKLMYSYRIVNILTAKYCFGNKIDKALDLEEFVGEEAFRISEIKMFISPIEVFTARKMIPNEEGVVLKVNNHNSIEAIYLSECSRFNYRIIYGVVRYKDGIEYPISLRMNYNASVTLSCYHVIDVMNAILDYYKIPQERLAKLDNAMPLMKSVGCPEYEVLSGHYWELRKNGYETAKERQLRESGKKVKREYSIKSGTYLRNIKGKASSEIQEFANKLRIELEEGTTLIREKGRVFFREIEKV